MKLTIAVCTYRRYDWLAKCLDALEAQTLPTKEFRVLIVDNSLQPAQSAEFCRTLNSRLNLDYLVAEKAGLSHARNLALARCDTPIIAYLDDDALATPDWAERLLAAFERHNGAAGVIGGKAFPIYEESPPSWLEGEVTLYLAVPDWGDEELVLRSGDPRWLVGANIAYKTQALKRTGGFPEHLGRTGELLLCHEEYLTNEGIRSQGYSVVYEPQMVVKHLIQKERMTHRWICASAFWESVSWVLCQSRQEIDSNDTAALHLHLSERLNGLLTMLQGAPTAESARQDALRFKAAGREAMVEYGFCGNSGVASPPAPTIYVVTPCRNAAQTIDQTILSVVSQAGNFYLRYHVQDGGSTDETAVRLGKWRERIEREAVLTNCKGVAFSYSVDPDAGMYDAIAKGFALLDIQPDSFMTWLNADDILFPGALSTIADLQTLFTQVEWVTGEIYCTRHDGSLCQVFACGFPREFISKGLCESRYWMFIQQEGTFWRKRLYDAAGGVQASLRLAGDYDLWMRFAQHADLWHFAGPLGSFHRRAGQLSENMDAYFAEVDALASRSSKERAWKILVAELNVDPSEYRVPCLAYNWTKDSYYQSYPSVRERTPIWKKGLYPEIPSNTSDSPAEQPGSAELCLPPSAAGIRTIGSRSRARSAWWFAQSWRALRQLRAIRLLRKSGLFADSYYLEQYPDVAAGGTDPLFHYVFHGWREQRDPNPLFSTSFYVGQYPDIASAGVNPLLHYLLHGAREGRDPSPGFSTAGYLQIHSDVLYSGMNPLGHYLVHGLLEGRLPCDSPPPARRPAARLTISAAERESVVSFAQKPAVAEKSTAFTARDFHKFDYAKRSHLPSLALFAEELYGKPVDFDRADLKKYQDLLAYAFIRLNVPIGSRLLEIGGGASRVLAKLATEYECWDIDKLEGVGNGPLASDIGPRLYRQVKAYIGEFTPELPDQYFDFVFSISTLEHLPTEATAHQAVLADLHRVMKPGAMSLHLIDVILKPASPSLPPVIPALWRAQGTADKSLTADDLMAADDIYVMSEQAYNEFWRSYTNDMPYEQFGRPTSVNILVRKATNEDAQ